MPRIVLATAAALIAGAAQAAPADALKAAVYRVPAAATATLSLPDRSETPRMPGVARTSLDHRFARDGLDGSLGFLCGLQPSASRGGAAEAAGVDPHGRFLGVKLHMSFR
jgi:hypothetical protein